MKLLQYWNEKQPPAEVAEWLAGFRADNPEFDYALLDEEGAAAFIRTHYGAREAAAFAACAVPAMQANVIRLCLLGRFGGIWVDADNQSRLPLSGLIERAPHALLCTYLGVVNNGFMLFREPEDAFLKACLAVTLDNIENRRFGNGLIATGSGVFNAVRALVDPVFREAVLPKFAGPIVGTWRFPELLELVERTVEPSADLIAAVERITVIDVMEIIPWIGADQPAYKQTEQHWINWKGDIYR